jgi:hypothetical protein
MNFMGNIVMKLNNIVRDTESVNIDISYLINTDLNNQDLPNTTSIPPTSNICLRLHEFTKSFSSFALRILLV